MLFSALAFECGAIHLVGGSLTYEYVGQSPWGDPEYRIKLRMYRDAVPPTTAFDPTVKIGIYNDDANHSLQKTLSIDFSGESKLSFPDNSEDCAFSPLLDFRVSTYEKVTTLPAGNLGYHLAFFRCCRNDLINLKPNMGQIYYAYIPATSLVQQNSSPQFADTPVPYVCVGDTINISYGTTDPDGDSLAYEIVTPYHGADSALPKPGPPTTLNFPLNEVQFANGYNLPQPFGTDGIASIDPVSGLAEFLIPNQGKYALAVEVREYRNGQLLGRTRRDLQFIAINCPENDPPTQIDTVNQTIQTSYSIKEGDTLEFPLLFTDSDTMTLNHSGPIFSGSSTIDPPYAQVGSPVGKDTIGTTFYWPTRCGQGRNQPYFIDFKVEDNGCPPKETIKRYQIEVEDFVGVKDITGPDSFCLLNSVKSYEAELPEDLEDSVYWEAEGGTIIGRAGKDKVTVKWGKNGKQLKAWSLNENKCTGDTARLNVVITNPADARMNMKGTMCHGDSIQLGPNNGNIPEKAEVLWLDSAYLDSASIVHPTFKGPNFGLSPKTYHLRVKVQYIHCEFIDTAKITVNPEPQISTPVGKSPACYEGKYTYSVSSTGAERYYWNINGGQPEDTVTSVPKLNIGWSNPDSGQIQVRKKNKYGCFSDTIERTIEVQNPRIDTIFGPTVVCPNSSNMEYNVDSPTSDDYHWSADSATLKGNQGDPQNKFDYGDSGRAAIHVYKETDIGCFSNTFTLPVTISYQLETSPIMGDTSICEFSEKAYQVEERNGSSYEWFLDGAQTLAGNGRSQIDVKWGEAGPGMVEVLETSYDSVNDKQCKGDTVQQPITITPNSETSDIQGPDSLCVDENGIFHVKGFDSSSYHWEIEDVASFVWQRGDSVKIRADSAESCRINVFEITKDSCKGPVKSKTINIFPNPEFHTIKGPEFLCIPGRKRYHFNYPGAASSSFQWHAKGGTIIAKNNSDREINTRWQTGGDAEISVLETSEKGCVGDTAIKPLFIDQYDLNISHVTTREKNDSIIEVYGSIQTQDEDRKSALLRKLPPKRWHLADSLTAGPFTYVDFEPDPSENFYDYKLSGLNACGSKIQSDPHRTIHLEGTKTQENHVRLVWNHYKGWQNNIEAYEVYRKRNDNPEFTLEATVPASDSTYTFTDADTSGYRQCYRIKALNQKGKTVYSWSNIECLQFESRLHIPNAFTPTVSGHLNDIFQVEGINVKEFNMEIYNRWGEKLFESNAISDGWDGRYKGDLVPGGSYIVIITHKGAIKEQTYSGTVTLLK